METWGGYIGAVILRSASNRHGCTAVVLRLCGVSDVPRQCGLWRLSKRRPAGLASCMGWTTNSQRQQHPRHPLSPRLQACCSRLCSSALRQPSRMMLLHILCPTPPILWPYLESTRCDGAWVSARRRARRRYISQAAFRFTRTNTQAGSCRTLCIPDVSRSSCCSCTRLASGS
jgi:hypothetical protein